MKRRRYIVSYDIANPKRLRLVAKVLQGFGYRLQYSVFECLLDPKALEELKAALTPVICATEDQVIFVALGMSYADANLVIQTVGKPYVKHTRITII